MKLLSVLIALAAVPATAQVAPLSFDAGKSLPIAVGDWRYATTTTGSESRYGNVLVLRCNRGSRTVQIERVGSSGQPLTIATSAMTRSVPAGGTIYASDKLLDAIAFSRGRFLVAGGAGPVLAIPSWPEAARAVEDCRI
ncbi:hypothetical protein [Sphingomonas jaspsi]|uniref:hypothetical protein n=1 Tax=Sphingomonas jaspsi TaxID=392409 RepID=UPI0004BCEA6F|nr:hypothetical protein [Sphingomonas jaspsi]